MRYYIHGYESSPTSAKAVLFQETLHAQPITYRKGNPEDLVIADCLKRISQVIINDPQVAFIGSSLGGFLATSLALDHTNITHLVLLNPAILPPDIDVTTIKGIPRRILEDMINPRFFQHKILAKIIIIRGTQDEVVPDSWILGFAKAQAATLHLLNDDHRFSKNLQKLPEIIAEFLQQ